MTSAICQIMLNVLFQEKNYAVVSLSEISTNFVSTDLKIIFTKFLKRIFAFHDYLVLKQVTFRVIIDGCDLYFNIWELKLLLVFIALT